MTDSQTFACASLIALSACGGETSPALVSNGDPRNTGGSSSATGGSDSGGSSTGGDSSTGGSDPSCPGNFDGPDCDECTTGYTGDECDECAPGYDDSFVGQGCRNEYAAQCDPFAVPEGALPILGPKPISYTDADGWSDPGPCDYTCAPGWTGDECENAPVTPVSTNGHLAVMGANLVNDKGQPVQLKGVSTHWLNWADGDNYETNLTALSWMREDWNLSVIRAAMGVEESGGYLDGSDGEMAMLRDIDDIVNNAVTAGVYVIIDFHTHHAHNYKTEAISFFEEMVALYGHLPNVLYETYNEPQGINWSGPGGLKAYHQELVDAIRAKELSEGIANPAVIIQGTPNWGANPDDVIGDEVTGSNLMYTVHFYACDHTDDVLPRAQATHTAGVPVFITEWGATDFRGGQGGTAACTAQADQWHTWMNANDIGWAAWKLDDCDFEISQAGAPYFGRADTSCLLKRDADPDGPWTTADFQGHGAYVFDKMKD